jgi:hypothetical protein
MCRQTIRHHTLCNETHEFMVIDCMKHATEKGKWLEKQGFWSKLFRSMPSCKVTLRRESRNSLCPFHARAYHLEYPSDNYGIDIEAADNETQVTSESKFKEVLTSGSSYQNLTMPNIQSNMVDPGIDWERWSHVRDHMIPPRSGPPPDRPLPPIPPGRQATNIQKRQASISQVRQCDTTGQKIPRKPVAGHWSDGGHMHSSHQENGPTGSISPLPRPQSRHREPPLPLILDEDCGVPEMVFLSEPDLGRPLTFSFLQNDESSGQEQQTPDTRAGRSGSGTNQSREKPDKFQYSPVSPLTPDTDSPTMRQVGGPNRRAYINSEGLEKIHSVYVNVAYISPRLEERIDDVEKYWTAGVGSSEERYEMRIRAETETVQQKRRSKLKPGRRVKFDSIVRDDAR